MAIQTIKFSEFDSGGDLSNDNITVGLDNTGTVNTRYDNPWTFLAPGTTGDRPVPSAAIYYRLRFNTTLEVYEYYDPTVLLWVQLSGSGTGTVNPGVANDLAYYAVSGTIISPVTGNNNAVLVTNGSGVPSLNTTLPTGLTIPGATITGSTAALLSGSVVAAPVAGTDLTNKTYVDSLFASGVTSITGTTNQVIASAPTGNVTLSLPQDIAFGSTPIFAGFNDINNNPMLRMSSFPAAVNYLRIGNSPAGVPAFIQAQSTAETDRELDLRALGNSQVRIYGAQGSVFPIGIFNGTTWQHSTFFQFANTANLRTVIFPDFDGVMVISPDEGISGRVLTSNGAGMLPTYQVPAASGTVNSGTANQIAYYATTGTAVSGLTGANSSMLVTNSTGVPAMTASLTNGQIIIGSTGATPTPATLTAGTGIGISNGAGSITISVTGSGMAWTEVAGTSQAMTADNGYISSNAGVVTLTLPVTAAVGTAISIIGKGAGGWTIAQNSGQIIQIGNVASTTGVAGTVSSSNRYDSLNLICTTANTVWTNSGAPQSAGLTIL